MQLPSLSSLQHGRLLGVTLSLAFALPLAGTREGLGGETGLVHVASLWSAQSPPPLAASTRKAHKAPAPAAAMWGSIERFQDLACSAGCQSSLPALASA